MTINDMITTLCSGLVSLCRVFYISGVVLGPCIIGSFNYFIQSGKQKQTKKMDQNYIFSFIVGLEKRKMTSLFSS